MTSIYDFEVRTLAGETISLSQYRGKVLLIVNTASACGFTPQYRGLQTLYETYRARGLEVLGFPCNQFGKQEPGNAEEIATFCSTSYGVTFPLFEKIDVNGADAHPLYRWLTQEVPGVFGLEAIKWNFTKFLVGRAGTVAKRYAPTTKPEQLSRDIELLLAAGAR
jgi:glutathione peroxidase